MRHQSQRKWVILRNAIDGRNVWKPNKKTIRQQQIQSLLDNFLDKIFHCNSEGVNWAVENLISASLSNPKKNEENEPQWQMVWWRMQKFKKEIEKPVQPKTKTRNTWVWWITKTIQKYTTKKREQHVRNQLNVIEESISSHHFWENWKTLNTKNYLSKMEMYG